MNNTTPTTNTIYTVLVIITRETTNLIVKGATFKESERYGGNWNTFLFSILRDGIGLPRDTLLETTLLNYVVQASRMLD